MFNEILKTLAGAAQNNPLSAIAAGGAIVAAGAAIVAARRIKAMNCKKKNKDCE
ncbi:MAG: hypothetical protein IBX57_00135 [Gammaproteobacteria bacterium]|nr:hypothetical protein [Gammaproteobacteria bacterium]